MKTITEIQRNIETTINSENKSRKRRVCAYARVSTEKDEQTTSYENQIYYYKNYIESNPDWEYVGLYSDEGISGTSISKRDGFMKMISEALLGNIDLIITKSISRFARNTVDSLTTIRKLKEAKCECYFEKENIYTFDSKGELLITIMSSLAQEESRSISQNVTWGIRRQMAKGVTHVPFKSFLGYDRGPNGEFIINEEESLIINSIYYRFLNRLSIEDIKNELEQSNIKSPSGRNKWYYTTIRSILYNEKYIGDALLQKTFTQDFITKKKILNKGEEKQYYIKNHHGQIIPRNIYRIASQRLKKKSETPWWYKTNEGNLSRLILCPTCNMHYTKKYKNKELNDYYYICTGYLKKKCPNNYRANENQIKESIISSFESLLSNPAKLNKTLDKLSKSIDIKWFDQEEQYLNKQKDYPFRSMRLKEIEHIKERAEEARKKVEIIRSLDSSRVHEMNTEEILFLIKNIVVDEHGYTIVNYK